MMTSLSKALVWLVVCGVLPLGVAACGGGGATVQHSTITKGQELMDLQKALDAGAISKQEYERERKKILEKD